MISVRSGWLPEVSEELAKKTSYIPRIIICSCMATTMTTISRKQHSPSLSLSHSSFITYRHQPMRHRLSGPQAASQPATNQASKAATSKQPLTRKKKKPLLSSSPSFHDHTNKIPSELKSEDREQKPLSLIHEVILLLPISTVGLKTHSTSRVSPFQSSKV